MAEEKFVASIDVGLLDYKEELFKFSVKSEATLKFLRPREVNAMQIPVVYKRMIIKKIISLQTPDTKKKFLEEDTSPGDKAKYDESIKAATSKAPKRLKFESDSSDRNDTEKSVSGNIIHKQISDLSEERSCLSLVLIAKKDDLVQLKTVPKQPEPLPIPGIPINRFTCDNCHHPGHKAVQNKYQKKCPYVKCEGYHYCGLILKHKEHKAEVTVAEREISKLEKQIKGFDDEIINMKTFLKHNMTNFVTTVKPALKMSNAVKYRGKDGAQNLQKDIRFLKVATDGKIPSDLSGSNLTKLLEAGKSKVSFSCDFNVDDTSCDENYDIDKTVDLDVPISRSEKSVMPSNACFIATTTSVVVDSSLSQFSSNVNQVNPFFSSYMYNPVQFGMQSNPVQFGMQSSPVQLGMQSSPVQLGMQSSPVQFGMQNTAGYPYYAYPMFGTPAPRLPTATVTSETAAPPLPLGNPPPPPPLPESDDV